MGRPVRKGISARDPRAGTVIRLFYLFPLLTNSCFAKILLCDLFYKSEGEFDRRQSDGSKGGGI